MCDWSKKCKAVGILKFLLKITLRTRFMFIYNLQKVVGVSSAGLKNSKFCHTFDINAKLKVHALKVA